MEQDCLSGLSCKELLASGDVSEPTEPKSNSKEDKEMATSGDHVSDFPINLQNEEGDNLITDELSKLLTTLQIRGNCEDIKIKSVQNLLQKIESRKPYFLKQDLSMDESSSQIQDSDSCQENNTLSDCAETATKENDHKVQINQHTLNEQPSLNSENRDCSTNEEIPTQVYHCIEIQSDEEISSKESENEGCHPSAISESKISFLRERTPGIIGIKSNNTAKIAKTVDEKFPLTAEQGNEDQTPAICFESRPIIVFDLPEPDQNEELSQAATPPPIILLPRPDSPTDYTSASKPACMDLCLEDVSSMLICQSCYALPITSLTVHMCKKGHQVCGHCFGTGCRVCPTCTKPLIGRNACVERFLERLCQLSPELFVMESLKMTHSHRPIECPHLTCQRMVASNSGLINHFRFEHPSVQLYRLHYSDAPQQFFLPARCQGDLNTRAIALLEVGVGERDGDSVMCLILSCSIAKYTMVAVWCAALYEVTPAPLRYRLQASTSTGGELAVTDEVISLHTSQQVWQVLDPSPCLILSTDDLNRQCGVDNRNHMPVSISFTLTQ